MSESKHGQPELKTVRDHEEFGSEEAERGGELVQGMQQESLSIFSSQGCERNSPLCRGHNALEGRDCSITTRVDFGAAPKGKWSAADCGGDCVSHAGAVMGNGEHRSCIG